MAISCRPIDDSETEEFLSLLCTAFGLEISHARSVFYTDPSYDLARKWALFDGGRIMSILTTSPLEFGWGKAMGIAGVATSPEATRRGLATRLLEAVLEAGEMQGESAAMLFAHREAVYHRTGFRRVEDVLRGEIKVCDFELADAPLSREEVAAHYAAWSQGSPARLRRTENRWNAWNWSFKACEPMGDGYVCIEPLLCREAVVPQALPEWPLAPGTEWVGLTAMTRSLDVPLKNARRDLMVMTRNFPAAPEMFMTDQF